MAKPQSGWVRLFFVYALVTGAWCTIQGAEAHRDERYRINQGVQAVMERLPPNGQPTSFQLDLLKMYERDRNTLLQRHASDYGVRWIGWLLVGVLAVFLIRFVVNGFTRRPGV